MKTQIDADKNMNSNKPTMLFDGDCDFCRHWIEKWRKWTGDKIRYEPYQKKLAEYPQVTASDVTGSARDLMQDLPVVMPRARGDPKGQPLTETQCRHAVQLVMPDGVIFSGAHAVFKALDLAGRYGFLLRWYYRIPLFGRMAEWLYQIVARNRSRLPKW